MKVILTYDNWLSYKHRVFCSQGLLKVKQKSQKNVNSFGGHSEKK